MAKKSGSKSGLWIGALVVVGVVVWGVGRGRWFDKQGTAELHGATVKRGPLQISVLQHGNLSAKDTVSIKSEIEGNVTIISLIPEGRQVAVGDLLVELDCSDLIEKRLAQEINEQNADAAFVKAKAQYDIQESQNLSDIEAAERKLKFAEIDLKKYQEGDYEQLLKDADNKILLAGVKRTQSNDTLDWSKKLNEKGFLTKTELQKDDLDYQSSDVQLKQAKVAKELFDKYDDPRKRRELEDNLKEADRGLERAKLRAKAMIVDFDAGVRSSDAKLKLEKEKLKKYEDQIAKAKIRSPAAGMVVYARVEGRMGGGDPIVEGTQVRERQEILQIPRTGGLIAEASVHESALKQVAAGMPCKIQVEAIPGIEFDGEVQFVALLPDKGSWWANPNQRLYKTEVVLRPAAELTPELAKAYADMRPGMSCAIEIRAASISDALYVPVQCVVFHRGETIAFVQTNETIEQRKVKVGPNNEKFVQVLEGLKEGEQVLLSPPPGFVPLQAEDKVDASAVPGKSGAPLASMGARPDAPPTADGALPDAAGGAGDRSQRGGGGAGDPSAMSPEMKARFEAMTPEEREKLKAMGGKRGKGGGRNGPGGAGAGGSGAGGGGAGSAGAIHGDGATPVKGAVGSDAAAPAAGNGHGR